MRAIRKRLGLTQAALAELFEVDIRTVRRWEAGHRKPGGGMRFLYRSISNHLDRGEDWPHGFYRTQ